MAANRKHVDEITSYRKEYNLVGQNNRYSQYYPLYKYACCNTQGQSALNIFLINFDYIHRFLILNLRTERDVHNAR